MTDSLSTLAQDMRSSVAYRDDDISQEEVIEFADRLDALAAQQVTDSAWRQAVQEWRERCEKLGPKTNANVVVDSLERRAEEIWRGG